MSDDGLNSERPPAPIIDPGMMFDRYELVCKLADGGMASVWIARQRGKHGFEKLVAVKTILPSYFDNEPFRRMFLDEAKIAARIDHTNVAKILDLGEEGPFLYIAMELVEGDMLVKLQRLVTQREKTFPLGIYLRILSDACAGLHAAHELNDIDGTRLEVVHRDVSPQNILVSMEGQAKVIDFGIARANNRLSDATSFGVIKGKIQYMAPEQARGDKAVNRTADIWAIGAILYHFVAKRPVYEGEEVAMMTKLVTNQPIDPLPDDVPKALRDVIMRCLAFKPRERFATMAELRAALEETMVQAGLVATTAEVAAFVAEVAGTRIASRREKVRNAIRALEQNATVDAKPLLESSPSVRSLEAAASADGDSSPRAMNATPSPLATNTTTTTTKESTTNTATTNPTANTAAVAAVTTTPRPSSNARWVGVLAAVALVGVGVFASGVWRRPGDAPAEAKAASAPAHDPINEASAQAKSAPPPTPPPTASAEPSHEPAPQVLKTANTTAPPKTTVAAPASTPGTPSVTAEAPVTPPSTTASIVTPPGPSTAAPAAASTSAPVPTTPAIATPATPPAAAPIDPKRARVSVSGVQNEHGVRKRDVQNVMARATGAMTECYQAEIARTNRRDGGQGTIRIETDGSGRITKATASVPFSPQVARCIERTVSGMVVAGVDTGEAVANVLISLEPN